MIDDILSPLRWTGDALELLDQRRLPVEEKWVRCTTHVEVADAIRSMLVRGAPAIGCAAAYGAALGVRDGASFKSIGTLLGSTRPTAVNLFWALARMSQVTPYTFAAYLAEAQQIHAEDIAACQKMGQLGAPLLPAGTILTHCNAGALATGGYGTALGVIRAAVRSGKSIRVIADETRPFLQGARLTAWELQKSGIDVTLITDNMAAHFMQLGHIQGVIVGADRIAQNGDTANKIGTYGVAVLAHAHNIPFYVAAPLSTIDLETSHGGNIPIEERKAQEVTFVGKEQIAPTGVAVHNPGFDVTPAKYITAIITEAGVAKPPYTDSLAALFPKRA